MGKNGLQNVVFKMDPQIDIFDVHVETTHVIIVSKNCFSKNCYEEMTQMSQKVLKLMFGILIAFSWNSSWKTHWLRKETPHRSGLGFDLVW